MIEKLLKLAGRFENFIKYCMIGVTGVTLDFIIFFLLYKKLGIHYQFANIISVSCGITNNFLLNAFFNFKVKDRLLFRYLQFYAVGMIGLSLSALILYVFIEKLRFEALTAKIMTIFVVVGIQYTLNKAFSFRKFKGETDGGK